MKTTDGRLMPRKTPEIIDVDRKQLEEVLDRARQSLDEQDAELLERIVDSYEYVGHLLKKKDMSLRRLRGMLFGSPTETTDKVTNRRTPPDGDAEPEQSTVDDPPDEAGNPSDETEPDKAPACEDDRASKKKGHGRNGADAYRGAQRVEVPLESLNPGDPCPECERGTVYEKSPGVVVRITGQAPVQATRYERQRVRCHLCGTVFTAPLPESAGEDKYDAKAASMIALLKYGSGLPFNRLEGLQGALGIPLPASTQWDIVHGFAPDITPAFERLLWEAAQGDVLHNDDTTVRILELMGERRQTVDDEFAPSRTGLYTSGVVATRAGRRIALFFSGRRHAGENLSTVLTHRLEELEHPIQMCDGLSRNLPKPFETIVANCLVHARRKFVEVYDNFSEECEYVLEELSVVYRNDHKAQKKGMSAEQRLRFHQAHSRQPMKRLEMWLKKQLDEKIVEPHSSLGEAIRYMLNHWDPLTLFLRQAGAPLDNNLCERALRKIILHRKNAMFFKTCNGARVGDMYMSLIHTCELSGANPFEYLTELLQHSHEVAATPEQWMPWNYRGTLQKLQSAA